MWKPNTGFIIFMVVALLQNGCCLGLTCYECLAVEEQSGSGELIKAFIASMLPPGTTSDYRCMQRGEAFTQDPTSTVECDSPGAACFLLDYHVQLDAGILGKKDLHVVARSCLPKQGPLGCNTDPEDLKQVAGPVSVLLTAPQVTPRGGELCACDDGHLCNHGNNAASPPSHLIIVLAVVSAVGSLLL